jgi:dihydrodipicolinate synthase/N-acetylneuraminate lyase
MLSLEGITPVMATPFREDETIHVAELEKEIDAAIEGGAAAVCGPGFGAEFYKLSDDERRLFIDTLVARSNRRVPVIAATSCGSVYNTIELSRYAQRAGADCLMVAAPRTAALPASEVVDFYSRLCDAVEIPVMLQDADFTGAGLPARIFVELAQKHPNFRFAKLEVTLPGSKSAQIIEESDGRVQIIYGLGGIAMLDGLDHGASAMMPGSACLEVYTRVYGLYRAGARSEATELFHRFIPYLAFALQHLELAIHIEKRVLVRRGIFSSARMRRPTLFLDDVYSRQMDSLVEEVLALLSSSMAPPAALARG